MYLPDAYFLASHPKHYVWIYIVLNYIGSNEAEGVRVYFDGREVRSGTIKTAIPYSAEDGRIVVGREYTDIDDRYTSILVDELMYFNQSLSLVEIEAIYNVV